MKTITIRLPDVEAAMLVELQSKKKQFKDLDLWFAREIRSEYRRLALKH
jgi:hypothetical protein